MFEYSPSHACAAQAILAILYNCAFSSVLLLRFVQRQGLDLLGFLPLDPFSCLSARILSARSHLSRISQRSKTSHFPQAHQSAMPSKKAIPKPLIVRDIQWRPIQKIAAASAPCHELPREMVKKDQRQCAYSAGRSVRTLSNPSGVVEM